MAQQNRIAGIDRLEINGQQYTWNETFAAYWSDSGEPRALQEGEIAAWRMDFQSGRNYGPSGHRIEAKIISSQSCPLEGRDVHPERGKPRGLARGRERARHCLARIWDFRRE